jgi:TrmH family RNA methyltransferase
LQVATNNQIRGAAKLQKKESRSETGLFLLEGPQGLKEVLDQPKLVVEIFVTPEAASRHEDLVARAESSRLKVFDATEAQIKTISDTTHPQGVVAVCYQPKSNLDDVLAGSPKLVVVLSQIRDPGNAGTILRVADAAGADAVVFTENSVDPFNPKVVRATTGSLWHVPMVLDADLAEVLAVGKAAGLQSFGATAAGEAISALDSADLAKPTVWVFGNEAWGFEPGELELTDRAVAVPIYGEAESLNLASAASICIYASALAQNA